MSTAMALATDWKQDAMAAIRKEALTGREFDAYDLQERHRLPDPGNSGQWGALFGAAQRAGVIEYVKHHRSRRPGRAKGACSVWKGSPEQRGMLL